MIATINKMNIEDLEVLERCAYNVKRLKHESNKMKMDFSKTNKSYATNDNLMKGSVWK